MKLHFLAFLPVALLLTACGASDRQMMDYNQVAHTPGVSPAIYDKMVNGDPLGISDIIVLSQAHVSSDVVIRYIRDHETIYVVTQANISAMQKAGVDPSIVDYILQTAQSGYWGNGAYPYFGSFDPYFYANPFYGGYFGYGYCRGNWHGGHWHGNYHGQYHHH